VRSFSTSLDEGLAILEPLLSVGVAPSTALSFPPSHYSVGDGAF
jgi:hypothetical protein